MKKLVRAKLYRDTFNDLVKGLTDNLIILLKETENNNIDLDDVRGSLIYNHIDDQQSEVISSIYLKYDTTSPSKARIAAKVDDGIEGYDVRFEELSIELMLNILDSVEEAIK
jgi:hypothetical protein